MLVPLRSRSRRWWRTVQVTHPDPAADERLGIHYEVNGKRCVLNWLGFVLFGAVALSLGVTPAAKLTLVAYVGYISWGFPVRRPKQSDPQGPALPASAVLRCETCNEDLGFVSDLLTGRRFECPRATHEDSHTAAVVRDSAGRFWLWIQDCLVRYGRARYWSLGWAGGWGAEVILSLSFVVLALGLALTKCGHTSQGVAWSMAVALGADLLLYNTGVAFGTQKPRNALRSGLYSVGGYAELIGVFAVLYLTLPPFSIRLLQVPQQSVDIAPALYFSAATMATVGYGDITPAPNVWRAMLLVGMQIIIGLYFLAVVLATIVGWASPSPGLPPISSLLRDSRALERARQR